MLIDSHCHLDFPDFADELPQVIARAAANGVNRMITISTRVRRFAQILSLVEGFEEIYGSVGTHPCHADEEPDVTVDELVTLAQHRKIVAIGEAGLDYHHKDCPVDLQRQSLAVHIEAARRTQLPLVIHSRDADDDMQALLTEEMRKGAFPALLHCYTGGQKLAHAAVEMGLYVSFSGVLTFKKNEELRALAASLPKDRLLVETDAPYLAPMPYRGKRNEPAYVKYTADALAQALNLTPEQVAEITTQNVLRLFSKLPPLPGERAA